MNEFEFLRNINIGQYLPGTSPLHRLDPRAKIVILTLFILALTFTRSVSGLGIAFGICLVGLLLARIPLRFALRDSLPPCPSCSSWLCCSSSSPHQPTRAMCFGAGASCRSPARGSWLRSWFCSVLPT